MKVLVVEDEERIAKYIKKGLEIKAMVVDVANDGVVGLDMAMAEIYDVIVLDRMLPKMNGVEVCRRLRKEKVDTPVLMLTAKTQVDERVEGLDGGADDYLGKPFAFGELVARIRALARRPKKSVGNILMVDNLELNTITCEVVRAGIPVLLTRKEYALLEYLMRRRGQIVSKDKLTEEVWSFESEVLANTAQVYVGYLRKKIDRAFPREKALIETVRGFGYRIGGEER